MNVSKDFPEFSSIRLIKPKSRVWEPHLQPAN